MPISQRIREYLASKPSVWHTPGHKGQLNPLDITEIDDSFPGDEIRIAEQATAQFFGSRHTRFLICGSSMGLKASIMAAGGDILIESNCHNAVREGAELAGVKAYEIANATKNGLCVPLCADEIDNALRQNKNIRAVVLTSPDYYGQTADIESVTEVVRHHNKILIADSAHGAHFSARPDLFPESLSKYADFTVLSAHKTMPAYTQSSYLCINNELLLDKIDHNLKLLGTTSPSYLFLAALESAVDYCRQNASRYDVLKQGTDKIRNRFRCLRNNDFSRVVIDAQHYGITGQQLYFALKEQGITAEKYDQRYVVFIVSIADDESTLDTLARGLEKCLTVQ